ncbi:LacI family DNA-binding transcriptional regulator [Mycetocola miduiensis]|uniref:DNA-binding transcriptional regulator, LacI/PurR family n=1 Tax=Mycetocola miduiensis TaxID=995034 RepID=A0A1I5CSL0_9MICO|nr:LacI family DNA-binding transcriptional regulator [Mycetocola miduiensis]SFN89641.1 DNA-binding transcriptional regulator, LacI/PurR family [Mycetocola miduiensis]
MSTVSNKKIGIQDVAKAAGVSTATVSQVYNNKGEVAAATRERVLEVGSKLGYRPNAIGQALRSGRSRVIGIVVSYRDSAVWEQTYMPYYRSIIAGAAIEAVEHGYSISAAPSSVDGRIETYLPLDGVIVVDPLPGDPIVEQSLENGRAVVTDGGYQPKPGAQLASVHSDMAQAIPDMLDHLARQSREATLRPALFVGPRLDEYTVSTIGAYERWCARRGVASRVVSLAPGQAPMDAAREILSATLNEVNAVHCLNETYCSAITNAAAELGLSIPGDVQVSVTGNSKAVGADSRVAYLDVDPVETGAICARTLIAMLEGDPAESVAQEVALVPARVRD